MQKKDSIPTPLLASGSIARVEIGALEKPGPLRFLSLIAFVFQAVALWWKANFQLLLTGRSDTTEGARKLRAFLEKMGGMWVKAGQIMSLRRDLLRKETCDELSRLQDSARGFSFELVRRVVEEELGRPLEEVFSDFSELPVAAASIGQTHEARLRHNGVRVAVKVQRPFVAESFVRDLRLLKLAASALRRLGVASYARWDEMMWELEKTLTEELDYRIEASSISRMRKKLRRHKVYAPKVFTKHSARRVLVMEFVEGVFMSAYIKSAAEDPALVQRWLEENNVDPVKVGERLYLTHIRQVVEDNIFHCDLHPGNIVLLRNSRFALIDFGSVSTLEKARLDRYRLLFKAIANLDYGKYVDILLLQGPPLPNGVDIDTLKAEMLRKLRAWETRTSIKTMAFHEKSMTTIYQDLSQILAKYGVGIAWDFLGMSRADLTLDASLGVLCPGVDFLKLNRKYERQAERRALEESSKPATMRRTLGRLGAIAEVPSMLSENVSMESEWLRKRALSFEGKINSVAVLIRSVLSLFTFIALGTIGVALTSYLRLRGNAAALRASWLGPILDGIPPLKQEAWILIALAAIYLFGKLARIRSYVQEKEYERVGETRR